MFDHRGNKPLWFVNHVSIIRSHVFDHICDIVVGAKQEQNVLRAGELRWATEHPTTAVQAQSRLSRMDVLWGYGGIVTDLALFWFDCRELLAVSFR
jgi:hypothetical protein